jgi:hypothetical protein
MAKIKVYSLPVGEKGRIKEIENDLATFQSEVGGYIEILSVDKECILDLTCNEEGKINGLPLNRAWIFEGEVVEVIAGNCFITRHDSEGNSISIEESDIPKIEEILKQILGIVGNTFILAKEDSDAEQGTSK